ncbi:phosphodiester glycosidase family protein, partial [Paenibacillus sepulcri]|nr:phosphodiester glycosidase family protein [Paenibacillus sepulcri]
MNTKISTSRASSNRKTSPTRSAAPSRKRARKRKSRFARIAGYLLLTAFLAGITGLGWMFFTESGNNFRYLVADTLITTQHRHWAKYIIGQKALDQRVQDYQNRFNQMGEERDSHTIQLPAGTGDQSGQAEQKPLVQIETISGPSYKGYLMIVNDPTKIRLGVPEKAGKGEKVSSMVKRTGAIAGVNGGGFADPNWQGNGFQPIGLVISQGKVYYEDLGGKKSTQIVGIDGKGKMIAGKYSLAEIQSMGVKEAVTFQPRIIVNGKGLI